MDKQKVSDTFIGIGTYLLFFLTVTIINILLFGAEFASKEVVYIIRSLVEILIISSILSLFFRKRPKSILPIVIGMLLVFLLTIPSLVTKISNFNTAKDIAIKLANEPFRFDEQWATNYLVSNRFLSNTTLLSTIYEWVLSSGLPAILINGIFLIGYKEASLKELKWSKKILYILIKFIPFLILGILQSILPVLLKDESTHIYALLNILAIFLISIVYLIINKRKGKTLKERLEKE